MIQKIKPIAALALALLASVSGAQTPDPTPKPMPEITGVQLSLYSGFMTFMERTNPDKKDFVFRFRAAIQAPEKITIFSRIDYTRTQDGGDLADINTFRSIESQLGLRKDVAPGLSLTAFGGVTWNQDDKFEPADARLWTAAVGLRYELAGRFSVTAAAGHHGPVGGSAFLGAVSYRIRYGAAWFGDIAVPLDATRFNVRPYTIKAGVMVLLKGRD